MKLKVSGLGTDLYQPTLRQSIDYLEFFPFIALCVILLISFDLVILSWVCNKVGQFYTFCLLHA